MNFIRVSIFGLIWCYCDVDAHLLIKKPDLELVYTVTEYNHCLEDEFKLLLYIGRQLDDCVTACALRSHCKALTYHHFGSSSMCELFQTENRERVKRTGCVYIQKKDITIKKTPCKPECSNGTTCNMETKSCGYTECLSLPNITNGQIFGNLCAVGKKIGFKCDVGVRTHREAVCQADGEWSVRSVDCKPEDCKDLLELGNRFSGVYDIYPLGTGSEGIKVRCDMDTPPGGWTIIQRRVDDRDFYKTWAEYKLGFGDLSGSFWLGNEHIWVLTSNKQYRLRIDLTAQDGMTRFAEYDHFSVKSEALQYALHIGGYHGNVGDSLGWHDKMKFSTKDRDNDLVTNEFNCAIRYHGAWWYKNCHATNLNGDYMNDTYGMGLTWYTWRGHYESLVNTEMKICP